MSSEFEGVEGNVSSEDESGGEDNKEEKPKITTPKKEEKISKENNKKLPTKKQKSNDDDDDHDEKEENEDDKKEVDESEDEKEEEEPKLGLLDQPVELSGSRERKKVQRLELSFTTTPKEKHDIPEGSGIKFGDCPRIEHQISKTKTDELKVLHKILFSRPGSGNEVRKNLRRFNGFSFTRESPEFEKKKSSIEKLTLPVLKRICEILDLERSGTKEDIASRILEFLLDPKPSGKKLSTTKKKQTKGDKNKSRAEKDKKKSVKKKEESSSEEKDDDDISEAEENEQEQQDVDVEEDSEDDYKEEQKKKKTKSKDKKGKESKSAKATKRSKKEKLVTADSSEDEESSDDEPLSKKAKGPPTDEEIKQLVKQILDGANLEEITMKKVIKQVFDEYPEFDLSDKKDFIKCTVRSLIS